MPEFSAQACVPVPTFGKNQFPDKGVPEVRKVVLEYIGKVPKLSLTTSDAGKADTDESWKMPQSLGTGLPKASLRSIHPFRFKLRTGRSNGTSQMNKPSPTGLVPFQTSLHHSFHFCNFEHGAQRTTLVQGKGMQMSCSAFSPILWLFG
jgi:hypothetical protein